MFLAQLFFCKQKKACFILMTDLCNHQDCYLQTRNGELLFLSLFLLGQVLIFSFLAQRCFSQHLCTSLVLDLWALAWSTGSFLQASSATSSRICSKRIQLFFEHIPLHLQVEAMIRVVINLLGSTVSSEQVAQNPHSPHPGYFLWQRAAPFGLPRLMCLPCLAGQDAFPASSQGMDSHRLTDN